MACASVRGAEKIKEEEAVLRAQLRDRCLKQKKKKSER